MMTPTSPDDRSPDDVRLGAQVRSFREMRGMNLRQLAEKVEVSAGFLSQLENGRTGASLATTKKIAHALGVTLAELVEPNPDNHRGVVRRMDRTRIASEHGVVKYVITKPPMRNFEAYACTFEPGGSSGDGLFAIGNSQELVICLSGTVEVTVDDEVFELTSGDSIEFLSKAPHGIANNGTESAEIIWMVSPPLN